MIKSQITLKQLEALVAVVDLGSFRKAAANLGTTQPNISNRIATLEDSLGVILMHRDAGSVRLSEKGKTLVTAARKVLWDAEALLELADRQDLVADRMRLGVTELVACTWLHPFLRQFRAVYPAVSVELEVGLSAEIEKKLATGQLDLALQTGPFEHEADGSVALGTYRYIWSATPGIARQIGPDPRLSDLLQHPVLVHARHSLAARALAKRAERKRFATDQIVYSNSLGAALQMAIDGMGVSLLPAVMLRDAIAAGQLEEVTVDWHPHPLEFFARYNREKAPRFVEVAARFAEQVAQAHRD